MPLQNCSEMQLAADPVSNIILAFAPAKDPLKMLDNAVASVRTAGGSCHILHLFVRGPTV